MDVRRIVARVVQEGPPPCVGGTAFLIDVDRALTCHHCIVNGQAPVHEVLLRFPAWYYADGIIDLSILGNGVDVPADVVEPNRSLDAAGLNIDWRRARPAGTPADQ